MLLKDILPQDSDIRLLSNPETTDLMYPDVAIFATTLLFSKLDPDEPFGVQLKYDGKGMCFQSSGIISEVSDLFSRDEEKNMIYGTMIQELIDVTENTYKAHFGVIDNQSVASK